MTEISSCHHLPTAPCVCQPCALPWPGDHDTYFYIKRELDKARDSTQDVRLEVWHCFPQTMKCAYVVYTVLASCLHHQDERKGVVPFVGVWRWFLFPEHTGGNCGFSLLYSLKIDQLRKCRRLSASDVCRAGVHQHMTFRKQAVDYASGLHHCEPALDWSTYVALQLIGGGVSVQLLSFFMCWEEQWHVKPDEAQGWKILSALQPIRLQLPIRLITVVVVCVA